MYRYGKTSEEKISQLHPGLQKVLRIAINFMDLTVLEGQRDEKTQTKYFNEGRSKVEYPNSKHNLNPSEAVDVVPYPVDWEDRERFHYMAGLIIGIGHGLGINIRWGGDWNRNGVFSDQKFDDLPHLELVTNKGICLKVTPSKS